MKFSKETPSGSFIIQGQNFMIPRPFNEGHVCTANEAGVLNQTLAENTRNNWSDRVKKQVEDGSFDHPKMQAEIDSYLEDYDFGKRGGRGPTDPVEREALSIARDLIKTALREKGLKLADIETDDINRLAEEAIASNPDITKEAKRRVDQRSKIASGDIDLSGLGGS